MFKIIYMGSYNKEICSIVSKFENIKVVSFIVDPSISEENKEELRAFWRKKNVTEIDLEEGHIKDVALIFVCGYTKIIKSCLLNKYIFVNIHAGNLPRWRGTSANSWAILNEEYDIAYTLHRVTEELDGGPIFYKYEYRIKDEEKYGDARKKLELMLEKNLEKELLKICSEKNKGAKQEGKYVYCNSFRREDGIITNWNHKTKEIWNMYRIFGYPYGTGLYFIYKGKKYEILELELDPCFGEGNTTLGAVVYKCDKWIWVKTKDTAVKIGNVKNEEGIISCASSFLNIGNRL